MHQLPQPSNGDLTPWTQQGVLLLNRALTTAPRSPAAHRGKGWEEVTQQAIRAPAARGKPLVSVLRGRDARNLRPLPGNLPAVESAHPSPMSADRGGSASRVAGGVPDGSSSAQPACAKEPFRPVRELPRLLRPRTTPSRPASCERRPAARPRPDRDGAAAGRLTLRGERTMPYTVTVKGG